MNVAVFASSNPNSVVDSRVSLSGLTSGYECADEGLELLQTVGPNKLLHPPVLTRLTTALMSDHHTSSSR